MTNAPGTSFGVIVAGSDNDLCLTLGAIESVRHFMPDVPIALVFDGRADLTRLRECYGLEVIRKETTHDRFLRDNSYGYGITKMVAFWESPFDEFFYLDSDACVSGDLVSRNRLVDLDMIIPTRPDHFEETAIDRWLFDRSYVKSIDPDFDPLKSLDHYFCTGTYFARRGIFDLDWYRYLLLASKEDVSRFRFGEMGILNYMIFSMSQRRALRVDDKDFQYLVPQVDWSQTRRDFPVRAGRPVSPAGKPMVLHYAGDKPYIFNDVYTSPMRVFRVNAKLRLFPHWSRPRALASVLGEDLSAHARFRKKIGSWLATRIAAKTLLKKATRRFRAE